MPAAPTTSSRPSAPVGRPAARLAGAVRVFGAGDSRVVALDRVDIAFAVGSFTAVMGPSGSGKSTLLLCAAGLDRLDAGEAWLGETELGTLSPTPLTLLRRDRVGFVFQSSALLPALTARENILLPLRLAGRRPEPDWWAAVVAATGVGERLGHRPPELSGGQQQRVAIARALVARPQVVFADEPTGALDRRSGAAVLDLLACVVADLGQTVVMVTHDPAAAAVAGRLLVLTDGRLVADRPVGDGTGIAGLIEQLAPVTTSRSR